MTEPAPPASPGLWYTLDTDLVIRAVSPGWDDFARANGPAQRVVAGEVLGQPLQSIIDGDAMHVALAAMFAVLESGTRARLSYPFTCDGPAVRRPMAATLSRIEEGRRLVGFRVANDTYPETPRIALVIIGATKNALRLDLPIQPICSCCKRLADPAGATRWLEAEDHAREGHSADVRLSHGLCPACADVLAVM